MRKYKAVIVSLLLLFAGIALVWLSIRKLEIASLVSLLREGNYVVVVPVFAVSLSGYWFRSKRWQLMLEADNQQAKTSNLFMSLCVGYLVNYAVPRLGEISRCLIIKRTDNIPVDKTLISVIAERLIDTICLFALLAFAVALSYQTMANFFYTNIYFPVASRVSFTNGIIIAVVVLALSLLLFNYFSKNIKQGFISRKIVEWKQTLLNILQLKQRTQFFIYTILIWCCYFLMTYLWFFIFPESSTLGLGAAFVVMVIGSIGRSVPIQGGGLGAYHFLVSQTLLLFGVNLLTGNALALVIHGAQSFLTLISGIVAYICILFIGKLKD